MDLTVLGDYYTNGSYGLRLESAYALRYKFRGNLSFRLENLINSERGFPDFSESRLYNIRWNHNQDAKASPNSRFSASVNLGSSQYYAQSINQTNNASSLVNTLASSVSYSRTFETQPEINVTLAATHSQNTNTETINMTLPNLNATVSRIFPFAPKTGTKKGILQNINMQYDLSAQNQITTTDSLFFKSEMFDDARIGARHNIPISTNFKIFNYLSASMGANYQETWVGRTFDQRYDEEANNGEGAVVTDTVSGFDAYRTYNFNASLGTTVYGTFNFGEDKKIQAIRHVMRPQIGYSIQPSFDQFYDEYVVPSADPEVADQVVTYSRFQNTLFGAPTENLSSSLGFSLSNTIEAKVRDRDTTATDPKKISLINNLNFSTGYDFAADSLNLSPVRFTGSIPIVEKLDFNFNGTLDIYALNNNNQRINTLNIDNGGSLFRLTQGNISINYSFSSKDFQRGRSDEQEREEGFNSETFRNGGRPDDLFGDATPINAGRFDPVQTGPDRGPISNTWYQNEIPWTFRLAYTMTYSNAQRQNEITSQSLMFSSNVELSPRWSVGISSGYDFKNKGVTLTNLRFQRDLESWQMSFNWTPIGARNTAWYFYIGIKSGMLSDIKWEQRREPDRQL
ncbi:putative LPS assembly protein LptD [Aureitalea marina]|uniref:putative LPS assembly protein LptD n=1 Tax=Aureitalea marina TaxID=930804 RepID=UPI003CCBDD2F